MKPLQVYTDIYRERRNYLVSVGEYYHLLPDVDCNQEEHSGYIKGRGALRVKLVGQQDGSRMKALHAPATGIVGLARKLEEYFPEMPEVWTQVDKKEGVLESYIRTGRVNAEKHRYVCIWTHSFLNGARVVPLIVCEGTGVFYNASELFPGRIPEDGFGIIVQCDEYGPMEGELSLAGFEGELPIEMVKYFAHKRMCHCCGIVSDMSKARKRPWASPAKVE